MTEEFEEWGWDWKDNSGSTFFISRERMKDQVDVPLGTYDLEAFVGVLRKLTEGLDEPRVMWVEDNGGGNPGLWVEGTRAPNSEDLERWALYGEDE